jgi:hypothetical protein
VLLSFDGFKYTSRFSSCRNADFMSVVCTIQLWLEQIDRNILIAPLPMLGLLPDMKSAFLQELKRDVYLKPSKESNTPNGIIWKLKHCLYSFNDSARQFYLFQHEENHQHDNKWIHSIFHQCANRTRQDPNLLVYSLNLSVPL